MAGTNLYQCDSCGWIYRPAEHAGRDLDEQEDTWACPQCQAERDHFHLFAPPTDDLVDALEEDEGKIRLATNPAVSRPILTHSSNPDIPTLYNRYQKKKLDVRPGFQRYDVWTKQKKSRLIESVLLGLPIPIIYFAEEPDGSSVVIDGQQRLLSIFQFFANDWPLAGLKVLEDVEGDRYRDLPTALQEQFEKYTLSIVEIRKESAPELRFDLFERLNTGATQLNDQELRNCVSRGDYNDYVKELAAEPDFRKLLGLKAHHARMADVELALRFLAFYHQTYLKHPDKRTKDFLNHEMELGATRSKAALRKAKIQFKQACSMAISVFGNNAFRVFTAGDAAEPGGHWERRNNRALMDVELYGFTLHGKGPLMKRANAIREAAVDLMSTDPDFIDLISENISDAKRVRRRFEKWIQRLASVMQDAEQGARRFDAAQRDALFKNDSACHVCGQRIQLADDAEVDHIEPFARGGKTKLVNAALAHRFCNRSKGVGLAPPPRRRRTRAAT